MDSFTGAEAVESLIRILGALVMHLINSADLLVILTGVTVLLLLFLVMTSVGLVIVVGVFRWIISRA
jgi:hypothetical protein